MSNVSHKNPNFISKPPHKLSTKQSEVKNKRSKKSPKSKNKMMDNNNNYPNKPLKVVHISNPMRYQVTAAEFRALVQGLTGRDAVVDWPNKPVRGDNDINHHQTTEVEIGGGMINISDNNSYGNNANDDQVLLQQDQDHDHDDHHEEEDVDLSACFEPSDYLSYDYFGPFHSYVDVEDLESTFQAFIYG
ncbi:uncharacterized protein LOC130827459 [Amaranthus tricolor]|uniref:uncharacterized protein LOC130827459 n=1 Tax=Amaranthus tricolor TaxID=29722 RepID=UPI00258FEE29|nr:uncharacterized protein LOC130827459 [Amaranthus tricolor]